MVGHGVLYGILLTDEFGGAFYDELVEKIRELEDEPEWIYSFPSARDNQLAFGIHVYLDKDMNMQEIHQKWEKYMLTVPQEFRDELASYDLEEPNLHVVSGKY